MPGRSRIWGRVVAAGVLGGMTAGAQVSPPPAPQVVVRSTPVVGGTVTGHVYCSDNQRPARFSEVDVVQESTGGQGRGGSSRGPSYNSIARGRTALDGSFEINNVPPGDYYVVGALTGYTSPLTVARMSGQAMSGAPQVRVDANRSVDAVVSIDRGAVVSGKVTYDDGAPVPGVSVRLRPVTADGSNPGGGGIGLFGGGNGFPVFLSGFAQTDDRGVYRVVGVPPGKYQVMTIVETESIGRARSNEGGLQIFRGAAPPTLTIYAPATMHKSEGQVIELRGGGTMDGIDLRVALNGLHTVKGVVEAKSDGHMVNSGLVQLSDATDNSTVRTAMVEADGTYSMDYVPAGTYMMNVNGADRTATEQDGRRGITVTTKRYTSTSLAITVADHDMAIDPVQLDEAKSSTTGLGR